MIILGLTGSMAMGKSTIARLFAEEGIEVHDSDKCVHRLYREDKKAIRSISELVPDSFVDKKISRQRLKKAISTNPSLLEEIENIIHPIVSRDRKRFVELQQKKGKSAILLDIPLLFENKLENITDKIIVVSASQTEQQRRLDSRDGMSKQLAKLLLKRQISDEEKRSRANYVIDSSKTLDEIKQQVKSIVDDLQIGRN